MALKAVAISAGIFIVFALGGDYLLQALNVSVNAFKIAGGLLVIASPLKPLLEGELQQVQHYLQTGNNLLLLIDPDQQETQQPLLDMLGIKHLAGTIVDANVRELGIDNAIVNAGGDLRVIGSHGERPWRIAVRAPGGGIVGSAPVPPGMEVLLHAADVDQHAAVLSEQRPLGEQRLQGRRTGINSRHVLVHDGCGLHRNCRILLAGLAVGDVIAIGLSRTSLHGQHSP